MAIKSSLRARIMLLSLGPMIVIIFLFAGLIIAYLSAHLESQLESHGKVIGENIASSADFALQTNNVQEMNRLVCMGVNSAQDVNSISILNSQHIVVAKCENRIKSITPPFKLIFPIMGNQITDTNFGDQADVTASVKK